MASVLRLRLWTLDQRLIRRSSKLGMTVRLMTSLGKLWSRAKRMKFAWTR